MSLNQLKLLKPLEDYIEIWEKSGPRSIDLLLGCVSSSFSFSDPYIKGQGEPEILQILKLRYDIMPSLKYRVHDFAWGREASNVCLFWTMRYRHKSRLPFFVTFRNVEVEGTTKLQFTQDGKIFSHQEFWGAHPNFNKNKYIRKFKRAA